MTRRRAFAVLTAALLALGLGVAPAAAQPPDEPREGYTIVLPELAPLAVEGGETRVLTGVHRRAGYAIEVPPQWNGELVMWAHGFRGNGPELTVDPPGYGLRERLVEQGYAWAASSYDRNGYDIASGVRSTRALAQEFRKLVGKPERTYLTGVSMGGHVTARSLEEHPGFYDGALPMCGVLGDVTLFDYFLDHQLVAEALAGVASYPPDADYATDELPRIYAGLGLAPGNPAVTTPAAQQLRAATVLDSGGPRPTPPSRSTRWCSGWHPRTRRPGSPTR
jgi:pimeloyl-ACP methyl ester carboxylesterase